MRWQTKAKIMKSCAFLPAGGIYRFIQKTFGRLKADPMSRIPAQIAPQRNRLRISQGKQITQIVERMDMIDRLKHRSKKISIRGEYSLSGARRCSKYQPT